jgi:hypothetical protein
VIQINQEIKPTHPDGWHFWEDDVLLTAKSYKELIVKVTEYRISRRKQWDDVQQAVNEYLVKISPTTRGPDTQPFQKTEYSHSDRVYNWLSRTYNKVTTSTQYASAPEATRRASACISCPYNVIPQANCGACESQMARMAKGISKGRHVTGQKALRACGVLNYHLATAVHLEDDLLGEREENPALPPNCWRRPS